MLNAGGKQRHMMCVYFTCQHKVSSAPVVFLWQQEVLKGPSHLRVRQSQQVVSVVAMRRTDQTVGRDTNTFNVQFLLKRP